MLEIKLKFHLSTGPNPAPLSALPQRYSGYKFYIYLIRIFTVLLDTNICNHRNYIVSFSLLFYLHKWYYACIILQFPIFI